MAGITTATEFTAAHIGRCVAGHGVASGRAADSPYPAGTISLQAPLFARHGIDLSPYQQATLNLDFSPGEWRLRQPDHQVEQLLWSDRHPPETFSFWRCRLQPLDERITPVDAYIHSPPPEPHLCHYLPSPPPGALPHPAGYCLRVGWV